jgi:hypothetical protein
MPTADELIVKDNIRRFRMTNEQLRPSKGQNATRPLRRRDHD